MKVVDIAQFTSDFDTTVLSTNMTLLTGVAIGTDYNARIGRKVCWKSLYVQGMVLNEGTPVASSLNRIIVFYDKQPNGLTPIPTDVLTAATASAPLNLSNRDRFVILMDKRYVTGAISLTATMAVSDHTVALVHKYKKLNLETIFEGTDATIASIRTGSIWLMTVGNNAVGTTYEFQGSVRMRFTDA